MVEDVLRRVEVTLEEPVLAEDVILVESCVEGCNFQHLNLKGWPSHSQSYIPLGLLY